MEKLDDLLSTAERAFASLLKLVGREDADDVVQDAAIQRFEYTLEAVWKTCQELIRQTGVPVASPKGTIRYARDLGVLEDGDAEVAIAMIDARNLTTHTYNEELARDLYPRLPEFCAVIRRWLDAMIGRRSL